MLAAEKQRLEQDVTLLREEIRIKDARMSQLDAHRRPRNPSTEHMAIWALRAAHGWSFEQGVTFAHASLLDTALWQRLSQLLGPGFSDQCTAKKQPFQIPQLPQVIN